MFNLASQSPSADVVVDGPSGRPLEIRAGGHRYVVTALEAVRDETAAYPLGSGPRTVFVVRSQQRRYRLVHQLRDQRWTIEELATRDADLILAA